MKPIKTHRCKELLEYNKNNYKPCAIQYGSLLNYFKENPPCWVLKSLEWSSGEWDIQWMGGVARIKYCPFCGKELENGIGENN